MASPVTAITQSNLAIGDTAQTQQAAKPAASQKAPTQATTTNLPNDTVQISRAAQTAVQEALETRTQTLEEAAKGDPQALRLLAQERLTQALQNPNPRVR
jgi:hypothetical protein